VTYGGPVRYLAVLALAIVIAACGSSTPTLDHAKLVSEIHTWAVDKEKADPSVRVQCPDDIEIKAGSTFHCLLSAGKQTARLTVTIENDKGYVTWVVG
jgi:hypothetical protein